MIDDAKDAAASSIDDFDDKPKLTSQVLESMRLAYVTLKKASSIGEGDGWELKGNPEGRPNLPEKGGCVCVQ